VRDFTYDPSGNRIKDSAMGSATYLDDQILSNAQSSFASDPNGYGNLATQTDSLGWMKNQFGYRPDGKLSSFQRSIANGRQPAWDGSDHNVANVTYYFDALGRRVAKSFQMGQGFMGTQSYTQTFSYLAEQNKILLGRTGNQSLNLYLDGEGIDEHLGEVSQGTSIGFATDHLGSVLNSDAAGVLHDYGPFGETLPDWTPVLTWDADPVMYGYSGRQYDRESGLYYNRARNYSPSLGRWLSKDPLFGSAGADVNPYRFVFNDPAVEIDPSGDCGLQLGAVLSGGAGAGWTVEGGVAVAYNPNTGIITVAFYGTAGTGSYAGTGGSLTGQVTVTPAANSTSDLNGPSVETNGSGTVGGYTAGGGVSVSSNGNVGYSVSGGIGTGTQYSSSTNITGTITSSPLTIPTGLGTNANTNTPSNLNTSSNTTSQAPIP
jgi:RHS repeat-associated protein